MCKSMMNILILALLEELRVFFIMSDNFVTPRLTVLTTAQIEQVHQYSLEILSKTGIRVDSQRACDVFASKLGASSVDGNRIFLPSEIIEQAIQTSPNTIHVHDRLGNAKFQLGADRTRFGIGVTNLHYQEPKTNTVIPFAHQHMEASVRLGHALPHYDVVSTVGILQDLSPDIADLYATLEMVANTTKPLVLLISNPDLFSPMLDMLENLGIDLSTRPSVLPYFNPVTPLIINEETSDKMFASIERGIPIIYSNYSMVGMSTPITSAGALALLNAELLAGLVLSQLIKEGAPVILGSLPAFFDMKTMVDFYDPQTILLNLACAEMMAHYKIPHMGTSGSGLGWGADMRESGMHWLNHLTATIGKAGLVPFVGGSMGSMVFSPMAAVNAHDIIAQVLRFAGGFQLDDINAAVSEVLEEGPGGHFLTAPLTLQHYKTGYYVSDIYPNINLDTWKAKDNPRIADYLRDYTIELMNAAQAPDDHDELIAKGEAFIEWFVKDK